jgi:tRNA(fMet)-specific endonuclease VapC
MSDAYLLDTNAAIALLKGDPAIAKFAQSNIFVPSVAVGELYLGAEKSARVVENVQRVSEFISQRISYACDTETARWYGRIAHKLRLKGRPIPQNDIWIAAIALQHALTLITRDKHFNEVDELAVAGW